MMRVSLYVLLATACVLADESVDRRSKLPYVADAVGNTLPPPSNVPATVGSPVNLLTPDRYEFYTFDESGELVKRLMTLEEIQAIVAAGEETEGLVTFANDNQPTIAFNFSQPPYTKVHSVVTNVQNVLKAQMEAHKNKPLTQPTLDTPDVSDSWSLILPSIFGNTGVDIVPDKTSGTFTTPETETYELDHPIDDNYLSKEGSNNILSSSSTVIDELKEITATEKIQSISEKPKTNPTTTSTSTTTTTPKPTTTIISTTTLKPTTTTVKPTTTTAKPTTTTTEKPTTTTRKPLSTTKTTSKPTTTTTKPTTGKPTTTSTTPRPRGTTTTTRRPQTNTTTIQPRTTVKPTTKTIVRTTPKATTVRPNLTTKKQITNTQNDDGNFTRIQVQTVANSVPTTEKTSVKYEKISTFIPVSTATYVTERTTQRPVTTTKQVVAFASTTKRSVSSTAKPQSTTTKMQPSITTYNPSISTKTYSSSTEPTENLYNSNSTTITTQSVSPSTTATASSTEFVFVGNQNYLTGNKHVVDNKNNNDVKENDQDTLFFDVAQSFSQIASDLGNFQPNPTTSNILDTTKVNEMNVESKESLEIDIPADVEKNNELKISNDSEQNSDKFVKISTINPHDKYENKEIGMGNASSESSKITMELFEKADTTTNLPMSTTIDPVLSESMDDLLSQIVNQAPQSIVDTEKSSNKENSISTTDQIVETTTNIRDINEADIETTSETSEKIKDKNLSKIIESVPEKPKNLTATTTENKLSASVEIDDKKGSKPKDHEKITLENTESDKKVEDNKNFVQISVSKTENDFITENITLPSVIKPDINDKKPEMENENTKNKEVSLEKRDKQPATNAKKEINKVDISKTTISLGNVGTIENSSNPPKKIQSTLSQPAVNKLVSVENHEMDNKTDKISEPSPKIDEFKKKIQKVNIDDKELANERNNSWKLISTVAPPKANEIPKDKVKTDGQDIDDKDIVLDFSKENQGLEVTTKDLGEDIAQFTELCNELAFRYWHAMVENIDKKRSFVLSPYSITSMLAMMFMGARGSTSGEMNEILKLDDMVTFNPHFTLKNISDSIETNAESGVIVSAFVRELFSDRSKGKILTFYKERAQHFYNGHVEEINFKLISDIIRRRTNLLVKRYSWGRIVEYMKSNTITMQPPLAAFSANIFQTDCSGSSVDGRDGEMYFVVSPNVRQRRLVPVPAVVYRSGFLAGYDPVLDATAAALGNTNSIISTLFLMPGQQGNVVHAEDLEALEKRLLDSNPTTPAWNRLLRTLLPRIGLELQIPRFSHKSTFNVSSTLRKMGLKDIFNAEHADLGGLNGPSKDLYLSDMVQSTTFVTCGEGIIGEQHHIEEYPENLDGPQRRRTSRWATGWDEPRDYQRAFHDPHDVGEAMHLPLHLRPRQARVPARNAQPARLKFDRPFLYFVRHNPSGMILYVGRYNPRLLP